MNGRIMLLHDMKVYNRKCGTGEKKHGMKNVWTYEKERGWGKCMEKKKNIVKIRSRFNQIEKQMK
ncbi:hypothetical protein [Qiania dongpingensis]|uniref:Uncharacterized protein n=1 Tax=Qiania dongpingensis TaxID=2763669 RepID=A0A7G9G7G2_9FIRM|nr:hypothetical protein [Qiania dongpingensis]QNM06744.1 hypothetical protein H9Q78_06410 [Qiania dongpingensis]